MADTVKQVDPNIRKSYVPSEDQYKTIKYVYERKQAMQDKRDEVSPNWEKWEKAWHAYRPVKNADDWQSDIYIPLTTSVIEGQLSDIVEQELRPWAKERGAEDAPKAKVVNSILDYTWDTAKSDLALFDILKDALIFGTGIGMEYYWKQPRTIKDKNGKEQKVLEYDDCYLEPVRLWDFFIDETARGFSGPYGARDCVRRYIMDFDDFVTFFAGDTWDPLGNAKYVKPGGDTNYYEFYKPPDKIVHDRQVEVLWYWNKPMDLLAVVANDVLVVSKPNPYKHKQLPFVRAVDLRVPYQFYGKGEAELLDSLQEETNTLRRMVIDRNHLDIDKPILVSDTLTIEDEDLMARPHGAIPVGDINAAKPFEYGDIALSVFKSLELLNDDKIRVTGFDDRQASVQTGGTATEAAILKEATLKRLSMKMWLIKQDTLVDLGKLRVENILQFYPQPKIEEILGEAAVTKAQAAGTLVKDQGKNYNVSYRNVRLEDQAFQIDQTTQQPDIVPAKGTTFFEARPQFFLPTHGGFDIRYKATASIPISKPLQQQKADEMYDRLIQNKAVDPWKLAEYLLESREVAPEEFKAQGGAPGQPGQPGQPQVPGGVDLQKVIDLAGIENNEMLQGKPIPPTPYAPVVHTEVHIEFMRSDKFKQEVPPSDKKILQLFTNHVMGEIAAQQQRGGQPGQQGMPMSPDMAQAGAQQLPSGAASPQDVNPSMISGGAQTPNVSGAQSQ